MGIHSARHRGDRKSKRQGLCKVRAGELGAGRDKGQHQPCASAPLLVQRQEGRCPAAGGRGARKPPGACVRKVDDGDRKGEIYKMTKYVHCVFVRHDDNEKTFLFSVDSLKRLRSGSSVLCETIHGETTGTCIGNSFMVSESALESIAAGVGAYLPLKSVVGTVTERYVRQKEVERFDKLPF